MRFSLQNQLSLWFGLSTVVIMFLITFLTQQITVLNIEETIDDALQKRSNMVAAIISSDITTDETSYVQVMTELTKQQFAFVPLLLRIISPSGKPIIEFGHVANPIFQNLNNLLTSTNVNEGRFDTIRLGEMETLRVYTISVSHPQTHQILAFVQAVESLAPVSQARDRLLRNGLISGAIASLLATAIGLVLIRRGFRPLGTILNTIDEVDYSHLKTRLQNETRPAELEQLAKSLTNMWQRLDIAVDEKRMIIGSMSHDLRTPLTILQGQLEVLLMQPSLSAEVKDSLGRMLRETRRLIRMVKNLLLNVQLESKPALVAESVNLRELLDEVFGDMWALTDGLDFRISAPSDVIVYGDRDLLKQMLLNIVDNAIKFTPKGGKVELTLTSENGWAGLEVSDTGRGISSNQMPHIMEAFSKSDTSEKPAGEGARLGLAIVKQIICLHNGQIDIQSQKKVGTSIRIRLPTKETLDIRKSTQ